MPLGSILSYFYLSRGSGKVNSDEEEQGWAIYQYCVDGGMPFRAINYSFSGSYTLPLLLCLPMQTLAVQRYFL